MKRNGLWSIGIAAVLLVVPAAVAPAAERSVSRLGGGVPLAAPAPMPAAPAFAFDGTPVPDGSFEKGAPPASDWTEFLNTTECGSSIGDWAAFWDGLEAPDGQRDLWTGGLCGDTEVSNSVVQEIEVPIEDPILVFWYAVAREDADQAPLSDVSYIEVDGVPVAGLDVSTDAKDTLGEIGGQPVRCFWPAAVDLSEFAGQTVELEIGMEQDGTGGVGNVRFDAFAFADLIFIDGFECGTTLWSEVGEEPAT